jgi:anoctamin-10
MRAVQGWLFAEMGGVSATQTSASSSSGTSSGAGNGTTTSNTAAAFWDMDIANARHRLNPGRLREQMFAYTVTNQAMDTLTEVGLPFVLRFAQSIRERYFPSKSAYARSGHGSIKGSSTRNSSSNSNSNSSTSTTTTTSTSATAGSSASTGTCTNTPMLSPRKKRVVFEDEQEKGGMAERVFLDHVREEAALPEYELFDDYSEMVTQFGYVVLWSAIWPWAGGGCLLLPFLPNSALHFAFFFSFLEPKVNTDDISLWFQSHSNGPPQ